MVAKLLTFAGLMVVFIAGLSMMNCTVFHLARNFSYLVRKKTLDQAVTTASLDVKVELLCGLILLIAASVLSYINTNTLRNISITHAYGGK